MPGQGIRGSIFFVLIPLAAMLLFALSDVRFDYLMIKDRVGVDFGIADIFAGAYYVFAASISVFNILFVRERTASQIRWSVSKAILTYAGILFYCMQYCLGASENIHCQKSSFRLSY